MFRSRKEKLLKLFMIIKDSEFKNDKKTINKVLPELKSLNLSQSEIDNMELNKYFEKEVG